MLDQSNKTQKATYYLIPAVWNAWDGHMYWARTQIGGPRLLEEGAKCDDC